MSISVVDKTIVSNGVKRRLIGGFDLELAAGSVTALLGPSGCGKTSLLKIVAGLDTDYNGKVTVDSKPVTKPTRAVELVFSEYLLLPWRTTSDNVAFGASTLSPEIRNRVSQLISSFGLTERAGAWPADLSSGEQARAALARALVEPPELLLLDEPFKSVDPASRLDIEHALIEWIKREGVTTLLVSHAVTDAVEFADRVILLNADPLTIVADSTIPEQVRRQRGNATLRWLARNLVLLFPQTLPRA